MSRPVILTLGLPLADLTLSMLLAGRTQPLSLIVALTDINRRHRLRRRMAPVRDDIR